MEKEHLIIIAILGIILYMCMKKSEGFYYDVEEKPVNIPERFRYHYDLPVNIPQHIRYEEPVPVLTLSNNPNNETITTPAYIRSTMNIMGSQHVRNHIRSNRRNNMMSSMMYGECPDPQNCASDY